MKYEKQLLEVLESLKAKDLVVLDVTTLSSITDKMVVVTGSSDRHIRAMHDVLISTSKQLQIPILGAEGKDSYQWVLLDFGDVIIHLMREEARNIYELDKLWSTNKLPEEA